MTQWILLVGSIVIILVVLGVIIAPARTWFLLPAAIIAVLGVAAMIIQPRVSYRVHRWETTDDAIYARSGWLWREWRAAPLSRVQTVDLVRGPLQQRFGLATVTITTASAKGEVKIEALDADQAEDLVHRLTVLTETNAGRQDADDRDAT
jgi:membrane protein YdbS with pleckstrin-like domain